MDIFTTVLTRVVPVPIKSADLKVKAVLKDAAAGELKEDLDHVENHAYYFDNDNDNDNDKKKQKHKKQKTKLDHEQDPSAISDTMESDASLKSSKSKQQPQADEGVTEAEDGTKHLDLYV